MLRFTDRGWYLACSRTLFPNNEEDTWQESRTWSTRPISFWGSSTIRPRGTIDSRSTTDPKKKPMRISTTTMRRDVPDRASAEPATTAMAAEPPEAISTTGPNSDRECGYLVIWSGKTRSDDQIHCATRRRGVAA